jgi:hypothetical protein
MRPKHLGYITAVDIKSGLCYNVSIVTNRSKGAQNVV